MGLLWDFLSRGLGGLALSGAALPSLGGRPLPGLAALSFFVGSLRRPILDVHQVTVDCQRARRESEGENLIRQRKVVFDWIARRVILIPHARLPSVAPPRDGTVPSVRQAGCRSAAMGNRPHAEVHRRLTAIRPARGRQAARLETAAARQNS